MFSNLFSRSAAGPDPDTVDFEAFEKAVTDGKVTVVDVREPHEFAAGHIPDALNLPLSRFDPEQLPSGKPVVLICQSGRRSLNALNQARAIGREDAKHYAGGMTGWRSLGGDATV
jgi:rhodanese-related sulfurtransferase